MAATRTSKPARGGLERFGSRRNGVAGATALAIALGVASVATALAASPEDPVKRGEYLARAGDCVSCHTAGSGLDGAVGGAAAEGVAFAGGLAISTPFGVIVSPNITPDDETGIGTWTAEDFWRSMHFGVGKRGEPLYPVMPYDFFTKVAREDSDAIFAYLKSLKPVRNAVEVNQLHWPYDMRFAAMSVWQALWFAPSVFKPDPSKSEAWNRGAYLVEALGHCGACHKPRNFMGAVTPSKDFTGATVDQWFAPNITTNSRLGIGGYTVDQLTRFFKDGVTPPAVEQPGDGASGGKTTKPLQTTVGPMAAVWRNSLQYLTETDAKAMATYLESLPPAGALGSGFASAKSKAYVAGAKLFVENCAPCHGSDGAGQPDLAPPLVGNPMAIAPSPNNLISIVLGGQVAQHASMEMPNFKATATDAEIADMATFVRGAWGNDASPVSPEAVATVRKAAAGR